MTLAYPVKQVGVIFRGERNQTPSFYFKKFWDVVKKGENYYGENIHKSVTTLK